MAKIYNLAKMTVASAPGTGTITLGSAASVNGVLFLTFAQAGVSNGDVVDYSILDVGGSETGTGTYTSSGTTLTRTVTKSTNSNSAINATAAAIVSISARAETLNDASLITTGTVPAARLPMAVQSDQETGTSTTTLVSPGVQQFHQTACKAWVRWTMVTTTTIAASYNVSSLTDNGTGDTTINFTTSFSSANYGFAGMSGGSGALSMVQSGSAVPTASAFRTISLTTTFAGIDAPVNGACFFGDQ